MDTNTHKTIEELLGAVIPIRSAKTLYKGYKRTWPSEPSSNFFLLGNDNKPLPRECVYRTVAPGTCLPSGCPGNVFTEPLSRDRV
jgi:hypothetical protein